jgi:sugar phosphate isomerase/epimerase
MQIGAMNHPNRDIFEEIRWMSRLELDFIDLTLEPPAAPPWAVNPEEIRRALDDHGLGVVGHTAYYLPIGHCFDSVRQGAVDALKRCVEIFGQIGVKWMNIHPDGHAPMHSREYVIERNLESLSEIAETCGSCGVGLMVENLPLGFNSVEELRPLLDGMPSLGLHLDIGHSNLLTQQNTACSLISAFGDRLKHVHMHDNKGGQADLHLPLGTGNIDHEAQVRALKGIGYDGTITLEVFSPDDHYLTYSRDYLRDLWQRL